VPQILIKTIEFANSPPLNSPVDRSKEGVYYLIFFPRGISEILNMFGRDNFIIRYVLLLLLFTTTTLSGSVDDTAGAGGTNNNIVSEPLSVSRQLQDKKTVQPTRQPTNKFVAPSVPEELITKSPTPTTWPTSKSKSATTGGIPTNSGQASSTLKPTAATGNSGGSKDSATTAPPTHVPGSATADDKTIGGAVNVNAELKQETKTALNSARYFMYTFLVGLGCFAVVFLLKRCVSCVTGKSVRACHPFLFLPTLALLTSLFHPLCARIPTYSLTFADPTLPHIFSHPHPAPPYI
jgi:hypothetical protein